MIARHGSPLPRRLLVATEMIRTHVLLPKDVVEEIDRRVGERRRSGFLAEAAREKLDRQRRMQALERFAGWLKDVDVPGWETPESTAEWVRRQRRIGEDPVGDGEREPD
jgi:hypothetical protein